MHAISLNVLEYEVSSNIYDGGFFFSGIFARKIYSEEFN